MKWTFHPKSPIRAALWQLDEDSVHSRAGHSGKLYLIDYRGCNWVGMCAKEGWCVTIPSHNIIGTIPYDTPEEELKALAIAMWRLG